MSDKDLLPIGTKVYGFFGVRDVIKHNENSTYPIVLNCKVSDDFISSHRLTRDLRAHVSDKHPIAFTLEDCPECYRPPKQKIKKYRVRYAAYNNQIALSCGYYKNKEEYGKDYPMKIFLGLELETEKEFEE